MSSTKRAKSSQRQPLSRERILQTALILADQQGLAALSMRKLAEALQVEAMSLYNHVTHKEDLLDGLVERVVAEIEVPTAGGDWREAMRRRAHSAHAALMRHPWATQLFVSRVNVGPNMLHYLDQTIACLHTAGFSYALADHVWNVLDSHLYGFTLQALNFPLEPEHYAQAAGEFLPLLPADQYPHFKALAQLVISGEHTGLQDFSFGLELLLAGLESLRLRGQPQP
jgi:AcrR family transcriptional regulator